MNQRYSRPSAVLRWLSLFSFLVCFAAVSQAQQKDASATHPSKMAKDHPLIKLGPDLADLKARRDARQSGTRLQAQTKIPFKQTLIQIKGDYVVIEAVAEGTTAIQLKAELEAMGLKEPASFGRMVSGLMPIAALDEMASLKSLRFAQPAYKPMTNIGKATSQGDIAMYADSARLKQNINGRGSKIGVLSDSYNNRGGAETGIKTGDIPGAGNPNGFTTPVQVLQELGSDGIDEGRAMVEIIHDVAPGAQIAFNTAFLGQPSFAQGILNLQKAGCNIITDDVYYFAEPFFQDGIISQAIDSVKAQGASYFTAAGNNGRDSYESFFRSGGPASFGSKTEGGWTAVNAHNFAPEGQPADVTQQVTVPVGATVIISFQYDQPFFSLGDGSSPGAGSDLDIFLLTEDTTEIVTASGEYNLGKDPVEVMGFFNDGSYGSDQFNILIDNFEGPAPALIKYIVLNSAISINEYNTSSSSCFGHSNAAGAISTGAAFFFNTPAFGAPIPIREDFSSAGGTPILFDTNGKRITPIVRQKPDIVAPDGGFNTFFGAQFLDQFLFFGTSAAAPHAAAVGALMQEANGKALTPTQVRETLVATAIDMEAPGFDFDTGYGFVNADKAVQAVARNRIISFTLVDADAQKDIQLLRGGTVINLTRLPTRNLNIRANTGPTKVGSVMFTLNGKKVIENLPPYDYAGDYAGSSGGFTNLAAGDYTLTATPYARSQGKGERGVSLTIRFTAAEEAIVRFELFNVEDKTVLQELKNDDVLNLADLPPKLNIRAITNPAQVGSVTFDLNESKTTENVHPYELAGSAGEMIDFRPDDYTLTATIYPYQVGRGTAGGMETIRFKVISSVAAQLAALDEKSLEKSNQLNAHPNPFSQKITIRFSLPKTENATLAIYDVHGIPIALLHNGEAEAGKQYAYEVDGALLQQGMYISRLISKSGTRHQKLMLTK